MLQIRGHGATDIRQQRQVVDPRPLASDDDLARAPAKIAELERHHLAGPQTKAGEEDEDGVVAAASGGRSIRSRQHPIDVLG